MPVCRHRATQSCPVPARSCIKSPQLYLNEMVVPSLRALAAGQIRVLSLHPGPIRTPMAEGLSEDVAAAQSIARFGDANEVARMVRFVLTEATFSTGSEFVVDGGAVTGQVLPLPHPAS